MIEQGRFRSIDSSLVIPKVAVQFADERNEYHRQVLKPRVPCRIDLLGPVLEMFALRVCETTEWIRYDELAEMATCHIAALEQFRSDPDVKCGAAKVKQEGLVRSNFLD